ncbi:MAG TPA: bifunctional D-glycero-beta-D-manno-heptose-7-phosphate kinase/D-glycero-beta-D-manno-heptose 1-phosphate adenylyltransferase HldE [Thiotrichales bacterium]|nr:bifunctional D-glycero-beta-D-manno-heptose-7-phosphate kinase/D-glycero-beta-D-manno-heptose 1-phosphate adenylyltransferase HldE [Thiotrichales bacterium]
MQIPSFQNIGVLVVGDVMLDRYWLGATQRISPEAPVPVVHVAESREVPGGAANVALNVAALGARSLVAGVTGDDEAAESLERALGLSGVECRFHRLSGHPTITKLRVLSRNQQLIRLDFETPFDGYSATPLLTACGEVLEGCGAMILSDYAKGTLRDAAPFIALAREKGVPVLVDPKGQDFSSYAGADLLTPNLAELEAVVGPCVDEAALVERGGNLLERHAIGALLVTRGEQGMTLLRRGEPALHLATRAREVYDVTGAGDTVIAVLAAALAAGRPLEEAMVLANTAAGIVVGKLGTATVSVEEITGALRPRHLPDSGVVTEERLLEAVAAARQAGERVVMTNGCFDILHAGHVRYLQQARALGDRLIVAVNDDASVRALKGEGRPVNPVGNRMAVLAALECVDWVVPFSEDTPERLVCEVLPDVLVKGGDYHPAAIAGGDCVRAAGGEVRVLGFEEGCSTTSIIGAILGATSRR